ncbi:hypothetical protein [Lysobacter sp. CA199]|uniref:hypothetical protein n=1 Tax=Lysobacter sp. CA199 TaxID=3455608 RepID=UPI003F8D33F1
MTFTTFSNSARMPAGWRHYLAAALAAWHGRLSLSAAYDDAIEDLFELKPARLMQLDDYLRGKSGYSRPRDCPGGHIRLDSLSDAPRLAQACLFVSACDASGYVREPALREFAAYPGRLALTTALIRCDDWVDTVRREAERLLGRLLLQDDALLFETLELALRLRMRTRFRDGIWSRRLEPALRSPRHALARWQATAHPSPGVRAWAYAAVRECDPERTAQAAIAALHDPHPRIALPALRAIGDVLPPIERDAALAQTDRFAHFAVRIEALRQLQRFAVADARSILLTALLDRSPSVRGLARYLLQTEYGEDAIGFWRTIASGPDSRDARKALMSLSSHGRIEDAELFVRWFAHPHPRVRSHALDGLILAKAPQLAGLIGQALGSREHVLFKPAFEAARYGRAPMSAAAVLEAWTLQTSPEFRALLVQTTDTINKWEALEFLLRVLAQPQPAAVRDAIVEGLRRWGNDAAYRFGPLDPAALPHLRALFQAAVTHLPAETASELRSRLDSGEPR